MRAKQVTKKAFEVILTKTILIKRLKAGKKKNH